MVTPLEIFELRSKLLRADITGDWYSRLNQSLVEQLDRVFFDQVMDLTVAPRILRQPQRPTRIELGLEGGWNRMHILVLKKTSWRLVNALELLWDFRFQSFKDRLAHVWETSSPRSNSNAI